jgi:hypothetical protein
VESVSSVDFVTFSVVSIVSTIETSSFFGGDAANGDKVACQTSLFFFDLSLFFFLPLSTAFCHVFESLLDLDDPPELLIAYSICSSSAYAVSAGPEAEKVVTGDGIGDVFIF